jgi:hypothetical protein
MGRWRRGGPGGLDGSLMYANSAVRVAWLIFVTSAVAGQRVYWFGGGSQWAANETGAGRFRRGRASWDLEGHRWR